MMSHETPSCELLAVPPRGSHCRRLGQCLGARSGRGGQQWHPGRLCPSISPTPRAAGPLVPRAAPPYLPAARHGHPPPRAAPAPPRTAAPPEAPWRRLHPRDRDPGAATDRERRRRDGPGGSGAAGAVPRTRPARRRRAEEAGGAGSSSRAAPAPARGGRAAGAGLGHGTRRWDCVERGGTARRRAHGFDPRAAAALPAVHPRPWGTGQWMGRGKNAGVGREESLSGQLQLPVGCSWLTLKGY